jgi:hypothetical protein
MHHKIKRKWLASLRSGAYEQIKGNLRAEGMLRCALGVLADVVPDGWVSVEFIGESYIGVIKSRSMELGLSIEAQYKIASMNDGTNEYAEKSFSEIADWIEKNL